MSADCSLSTQRRAPRRFFNCFRGEPQPATAWPSTIEPNQLNPYTSPQGNVPKPYWSGMPLWLRRFLKICMALAILLALFEVPLYWKWGQTESFNGSTLGDLVQFLKGESP